MIMNQIENMINIIDVINKEIKECNDNGIEFETIGKKCNSFIMYYIKDNEGDFIRLAPFNNGNFLYDSNGSNYINMCFNNIENIRVEYSITKEGNKFTYMIKIVKVVNGELVDGIYAKATFREYRKYLKTYHWKEIRKEKLKEADFKCQLCNNKDSKLNVHHNNYENIGHEEMNDLIVLCEDCHAKFHDREKKE